MVRREKSMRLYFGSFKEDHIVDKLKMFFYKKKYETVILKDEDTNLLIEEDFKKDTIYTFYKACPDWHTGYDQLKEHRSYITEEFYKKLNAKVLNRLARHDPPVIGLHVRKGDFQELKEGEELTLGSVARRTPNQFFIDIVKNIRLFTGKKIPATIFSDGKKEDLRDILALENTKLAEDDLDIVHLLLLSKSKVIVLSAGSTFSGWSAFLSDAVILHNENYFVNTIRDKTSNRSFYEGVIASDHNTWPSLLKENLLKLEETIGLAKSDRV